MKNRKSLKKLPLEAFTSESPENIWNVAGGLDVSLSYTAYTTNHHMTDGSADCSTTDQELHDVCWGPST